MDPLETYRFDRALHWIYNPFESVFGHTVFDSFTPPARKLSMYVIPTDAISTARTLDLIGITRAELEKRLPDRIQFSVLPEKDMAVGGCMMPDGTRVRAVVLRKRGRDIAAYERSADPADGPDLNEHLSKIQSSLYPVDIAPIGSAADPDEELRAGMLRLLRGNALQWGKFPQARQVFALSEVLIRMAVGELAPTLLDNALILAMLQQTTMKREPDEVDQAEYSLIQLVMSNIYTNIAALRRGAAAPAAVPESYLDGAFWLAEQANELQKSAPTASRAQSLLELALTNYLVTARREQSLLQCLFAVTSGSPPRPSADWGPDLLTLLERIANAAGRLADARNASNDAESAAEADRISIAALRLLRARDRHYVLDSQPIDAVLGDRLFACARHLSAADDPLTQAEVEALRREAAELGPGSARAEVARRGFQQAQEFLAALDEGHVAEAANLADKILDPSWEDAGRFPIAEQLVRAEIAQRLGRTAEMAAATEEAAALLGMTLDPATGHFRDAVEQGAAAGDRDAAMERADHLLQVGSLLLNLHRRDDAIVALNHAAAIVGGMALVGELAMRVLEAGAAAVAPGNGLLAARLSIAAVVVIDGLRLELATGEDRIRQLDGALEGRIYRNAVARNLDQGRAYEALCIADRARARSLLESVQGGRRVMPADQRPPGSAWAAVSDDSSQLERLSTAVLEEVSQRYRSTGAPIPLSPDQVDHLALQEADFLIPQPLQGELVMFVLTGKGALHVQRTPMNLGELESKVLQMRSAMRVNAVVRGERETGPDPESVPPVRELLRDLYDALIAPVAGWLTPSKPITIVPHRDLALIPWAALISSDGRSLVDDFQIGVAPSLATWDSLWVRGVKAPPLRAYVAADPVLGPQLRARGYGALRAARSDAERIGRYLEPVSARGQEPVIVVGGDASETSYRSQAAHATLVHLACHAALHEPASESCLYLARDALYDGLLTAAEVKEIPLDRAIAFLAACDTGQGRLTSEGVLGLGQAFLDAGAQAAILTLSKVADAVASSLSEHFYECLLQPGGKQTAGAALRFAMLATRRDLEAGRIIDSDGTVLPPDPGLWGTFFVLGRESARVDIPKAS